MSKLFYYNELDGTCKSFDELLCDLNSLIAFNPYIKLKSVYCVFVSIIHALLLKKTITLLDSDLTEEEIFTLIGFSNLDQYAYEVEQNDFSISNIINSLYDNEGFKLILFTSGTTGQPKKVEHTLQTLIRLVKISERHAKDIWGFAYNTTHMAGLQVFFQALSNRNTIIQLFGLPDDLIKHSIKKHKVTHLSATPSFYRLFLDNDIVLDSVKSITSGGEKFDDLTAARLARMFPAGKFYNIYASTEAGSLFVSKGNVFTVDKDMVKHIQIKNKELLVHKSLVANVGQMVLDGEWFKTGDLVEILSENPLSFYFVSRQNDLINVGGYNVNPYEVEEAIRLLNDVEDVLVFGKKNALLGNIICAQIQTKSSILHDVDVRESLSNKLQDYKIPRIITFVELLEKTRTGKVKRS